jgi:hypothetical protein
MVNTKSSLIWKTLLKILCTILLWISIPFFLLVVKFTGFSLKFFWKCGQLAASRFWENSVHIAEMYQPIEEGNCTLLLEFDKFKSFGIQLLWTYNFNIIIKVELKKRIASGPSSNLHLFNFTPLSRFEWHVLVPWRNAGIASFPRVYASPSQLFVKLFSNDEITRLLGQVCWK